MLQLCFVEIIKSSTLARIMQKEKSEMLQTQKRIFFSSYYGRMEKCFLFYYHAKNEHKWPLNRYYSEMFPSFLKLHKAMVKHRDSIELYFEFFYNSRNSRYDLRVYLWNIFFVFACMI